MEHRTREQLEYENAMLNRFEIMLKEFVQREGIGGVEGLQVLMSVTAHHLGHGSGSLPMIDRLCVQLRRLARDEFAEHVAHCIPAGKQVH